MFLGFLFFILYPMLASLYNSFTEYHFRAPSEWIGLTNYTDLFDDERFWIALYNTGYMVVFAVPLPLFCSFCCAVLLNLKLPGQSIYRVVYFLPAIVPLVQSGRLKPERFLTHRMKLEDGAEAYRLFDAREDGVLKTIMIP